MPPRTSSRPLQYAPADPLVLVCISGPRHRPPARPGDRQQLRWCVVPTSLIEVPLISTGRPGTSTTGTTLPCCRDVACHRCPSEHATPTQQTSPSPQLSTLSTLSTLPHQAAPQLPGLPHTNSCDPEAGSVSTVTIVYLDNYNAQQRIRLLALSHSEYTALLHYTRSGVHQLC